MPKAHIQSEAAEIIARECLATRMCRLNRLVGGIYDRSFRPIGATASQMSILVVLAGTEGSKPVEVCRALQMDKSTLSRNVQRLLRQGWVRTTASDDARSHKLELTEIGRELIDLALPLWREAQAEARESLGQAVADQLFKAVDTPFSQDRQGVNLMAGDESVPRRRARNRSESNPVPVSIQARTTGQPEARDIFFWE